jgi:hypothetical protein
MRSAAYSLQEDKTMPRVLDLNNLKIPTLDLVFADEARTTIHVTAPTEALIDEMENWIKTGMDQLSAGDSKSVELTYDLTARLISCNKERLTITADDLHNKYSIDIWTLIAILNAYTEFISDIKNEKN